MAKVKYTGNYPDWVELTGEIIAQNAKESAWKYGTKKAKYTYAKGDGFKNKKQYGKYYANLEKAFPRRKVLWGKQTACGASCDVFASTMVISSGYDKKVPRGLSGQYKHFAQSSLWKNVKAYSAKDRKAGDYVLWRSNKGGHACIADGNGHTFEAGYNTKRYGCTTKAKDYKKSSYKFIGVYRPTKALRKYVVKGDEGIQVKRVQKFLKWAGFFAGNIDGAFGNNTHNAVVKFQKAVGLKGDGKFGTECVAKAKEWTIEVKEKYDGKLPSKTLRKGSKGTQVKYLQSFLDWYDDYDLIRDGVFGDLTVKAVKDFQKKEGLVVDGVFGAKSLAKAKAVEK